MSGSPPSEEDLRILVEQLGREPRGVHHVELRSKGGEPVVISTYPLLREGDRVEPFPTLFWLCHPTLHAAISSIESDGWIGRVEQALIEDPELRAAYEQDHRAYAEERWNLLSPEDRTWVQERGWEAALRARGIGGILNPCKVKCFHLQWAHHLCRGSTIGRWMEERFTLPTL